jgi:enoyl-CoA hydratase/carnithine racemase
VRTEYGPFRVAALDHDDARGGAVVVTIDNPPTNLVDGPFVMGLMPLVDDLIADTSLRAVVFRSADPDFFLMHGDVHSLVSIPASTHIDVDQPNIAAVTFQRIAAAPFVSIGLIDGAARGGGCEFLSALDLRYGTPRTVIGQPEVPMGILPGAGGTVRLPRIIGRTHAIELIVTGRDVDADEAFALGWLTAVVPADDIEEHVLGIARRIAAMPAASIAAVKRVVDQSLSDPNAALVAETNALGALTASGAHHEPMRRFLAAGGQTREGESGDTTALVEAMLRPR